MRKIKNDIIYKACEEIDAAMFSGDAFLDEQNRSGLRVYLERWEREMKTLEKIKNLGPVTPYGLWRKA